jgi:hypothetical protein
MGKKKFKLKEILNKSNIQNFVQGTWNHFKDNSNFFELSTHVKEQAFYRAWLCQPCYAKGSCLLCGCKTPEMFYSPNKTDAGEKWGKMLNKYEWEEFKKEKGIILEDLVLPDIVEEESLPPWEVRKLLSEKNWEDEIEGQDIYDEGGPTLPESDRD